MRKRAVLMMSPEALPDAVRVLADAEIAVIRSVNSHREGVVALIIEGHSLPNECAGLDLHQVRARFVVDHYGSQKLTKLSGFELDVPVKSAALAF